MCIAEIQSKQNIKFYKNSLPIIPTELIEYHLLPHLQISAQAVCLSMFLSFLCLKLSTDFIKLTFTSETQ